VNGRVPGSILCGPSLSSVRTAPRGNLLCIIAGPQIADDGLLVSLVQKSLDKQC
jgi:hypothetical protein